MDSLDFINTHKLILNNKEIDTIETNGNTDNKTILTKSAVNNAISEAISGGGTLIGEYKSSSNTIPKIIINETNGITLNNKSVIDILTSGTSNNDKLTTQGFTDATYAKIENVNVFTGENTFNNKIFANDNLTINADKILKTNNIQTNTSTEKDIINYDDSTSSTKLTYGNTTDETIITGNNNIVQINNRLFVDELNAEEIITGSIATSSIISSGLIVAGGGLTISSNLTLGGPGGNSVSSIITGSGTTTGSDTNLYTGLKIDNLLDNKVNTSSVKTSSSTSDNDIYACTYMNTQLNNKVNTSSVKTSSSTSDSDIYACTYINTQLNNKVNTSSVKTSSSTTATDIYACTYINTQLNNKVNTSSVKNTSSSTSTSDIYCCKYIDDNYAKLSGNNTFSGTSNTFNNVIYTNGGISAFTTSSTTNPNHIKMKFVDNTVSSVDNDYVEFVDDNTTPNTLLRIYQDGKTYSPVFTTQNADYAELFEVYDESIPIKDYEYKFISLIDDKVKIASNEDDYILGVYSLKPGIIGNYNLNDLNNKKNIQVGLLGRLVVIDNNTCKSNSYCKVDKDGYAIPYNKSDGDIPHYKVMKRIDNNKILIMFK